jgi:hypothetical protein
MTYLICPHCRYPNEIRSPYLTFCNKCSRKIEKNYTDWSKNHPDFTFEDYKQIEGSTGLLRWELEKTGPSGKKTFPRSGRIAILLVGILAIGSLLSFFALSVSTSEFTSWSSIPWTEKNEALLQWHTITVPEDNFEVRMPAKPKVDKSMEENDLGILKYSNYTVVQERGKNTPYHYSISLLRYPAELIHSRTISTVQSREFLDYSVGKLIQKGKAKLIHQKEITYGLYPGKEVVLSDASENSESRLRLYLIENALYTLRVSMDADNRSIRAAEKFLNSFKLLAYADGKLQRIDFHL